MGEFTESAKRLVPDSFRQRLDDWGVFGLDEWGDEGLQAQVGGQEPVAPTAKAGGEWDGGLANLVQSAVDSVSDGFRNGYKESPQQASEQYIVQSGDTLSGVAQKYGLSVEQLALINPQIKDIDKIWPGESVNVVMPEAPSPILAGSKDDGKSFGGMVGIGSDAEEQSIAIDLGSRLYVGTESPEEDRAGWVQRAESMFQQIADGSLPKDKWSNLNHLLEFTEKAVGTAFTTEMDTLGIDVGHVKQMMAATYAGETDVGTNVKPSGTGAVGELQVTASTFKSVLKQGQFGKKAAKMVGISLSKLKKMGNEKLRDLLTKNKEVNFLVSISKWMQLLKAELDKGEGESSAEPMEAKLASTISEKIEAWDEEEMMLRESGDSGATQRRLDEINAEKAKEGKASWEEKGSLEREVEVMGAEGGVLLDKNIKSSKSSNYGNLKAEDDGELFQGRSLVVEDSDLESRPRALDKNPRLVKDRKGKINL